MPFNDNGMPPPNTATPNGGISLADIVAFLQRLRSMAPSGNGVMGAAANMGRSAGLGMQRAMGAPPQGDINLPPSGAPMGPRAPMGARPPMAPPPGLRQSPLMSAISARPGLNGNLPGAMSELPPAEMGALPGSMPELPPAPAGVQGLPLTPANYQGFDNNMPNVGPQNSAMINNANGPQSTGDLVSLIRRLLGR